MLSAAPTDYVLSGYSWPNPAHITYSFPPDGTLWDQGTNNLNASLGAAYPGANWQRIIAEALQTWASVADINVVPVADGGQPFNVAGLPQGDPRFGDIRIGGYNFQSTTVLAQTYGPPPNGVTGAGDVEVNTGFTWGPNAPYDLYSVLLHETGLALGLGETTDPTAVMNRVYGGVRAGLEPVDVAGIQAIYGPRTPDPLQVLGQATSPGSAFDLTARLAPVGSGQQGTSVAGLSLDRVGDTEYFSVVAPAGAGPETLSVLANSQGISSLSPKVTIDNAAMQPIASMGNPALWSDAVTASATGIVPGRRYYIAVSGATSDVFSVGAYNLQVTFGGIATAAPSPPTAPPSVPPPPTEPPPRSTSTTPSSPPSPTTTTSGPPARPVIIPDRFEPDNTAAQAVDLGALTARVVTGLTIVSATDYQVFTFVASAAGSVAVATGSTSIRAVDPSGRTIASGTARIGFDNPTAGARYWIVVGSADGQGDPGFAMSIAVTPASTPTLRVALAPPLATAADVATPRVAPAPAERPRRAPSAPVPAATPEPAASGWARFAPPMVNRPLRAASAPLASRARVELATVNRPLRRVAVVDPRWMRAGSGRVGRF